MSKFITVNVYTRIEGRLYCCLSDGEMQSDSSHQHNLYHTYVTEKLNTPYEPEKNIEYVEMLYDDVVVKSEKRTNYRI